jgi:hypothetical protein
MRKIGLLAAAAIGAALWFVGGEREAAACGGCFVQPDESTVVNDHRMVFAISSQETILWDQIEYDGDPQEFAWVLPVRQGARIELSRDEWITALDATSRPRIQAPRQAFGVFDGEGGGCGCGVTDFASASAGRGDDGPPPVEVVSQKVVGPYETVIVRSTDPEALQGWLRDNGYAVPPGIEPVIAQYTGEGFDFVALRLRPGQGIRAMKPVRIVTPGADPTLPLRMVAAGVGANVGLTLFVISEGRYRPQNFPEALIDDEKLLWDNAESRSNYQELALDTMAEGDGRTWLAEFAGKPVVVGGEPQSLEESTRLGTTTLYSAYYGACRGQWRTPEASPLPEEDAGHDTELDAGSGDAGESDAGESDAGESDAGEQPELDAGAPAPEPPRAVPALCRSGEELCCEFDDLEVAIGGLHTQDIWLTRLRANLPAGALDADLRLEAHPTQEAVSNLHQARLPGSTTNGTASIVPRHRT